MNVENLFMPINTTQKIVFGIMVALCMVYGMEVYNALLRSGGINSSSFIIPIDELFALSFIVFLLQTLIGGPLARKLAANFVKLKIVGHNYTLIISICTVVVMCPMMSFVATLLFKGIDGYIIIKWIKTFALNFPMAFCWQLLIVGPLVRFIFRQMTAKQLL